MTCARSLLLLLLLLSVVLAQETTGEVPSPASTDTPAPTPAPITDAPATTAPPPTTAPETPTPAPSPSPKPTTTDAPAPTANPTWTPAPPTQAPVTNPPPNPGNNHVVTPPPAATAPPTVVISPSTGSSSTTAMAATTTSPPKEKTASRPTTNNSTTSTETASGSNMDVVVGVLGGIIGAGVLALGVVCVLRRRQRKNVPARDSTFWPISPPPAMLEASPRKPSTFFRKHQSALASLDGSRSTAISDDILDSFAPNRRSSALFLRDDFGRSKSVQIDVAESVRPSNILVGSVHIDDDDFDGDVDALRGHHQSYTL